MKRILLFSLVLLAMFGCKTQQKSSTSNRDNTSSQVAQPPFTAALPTVLIYKTSRDYRDHVPVTLSDDQTQIVTYPHPADLYYNEKLAVPSKLHDGYLLDNRGINKNVAFLKYTYQEYSRLSEAPGLHELQESIIDKEPLTELWECGKKATYTDLQQQLNKWIDKNLLPEKCKRIK